MDFKEAMEYLELCQPPQMTLGLDSIEELLRRMGNPEQKLKFVHVGGTNGKGSTAAFLSSILACAGLRVGRYISPTISDYCERIQVTDEIGTTYISRDDVADKITKIKTYVDDMSKEGYKTPSPFEMETVMAFLAFEEKNCDIVVLEVGLGGRLDATNVISNKELCILCSISMDHMGILGNTIGDIAREKVEIIKENTAVVTYDYGSMGTQGSIIRNIVEEKCKAMNAKCLTTDFNNIKITSMSLSGTQFSYETYHDLKIPLLGVNQPKNAVLSLVAALHLRDMGYKISDEHIRLGLERTTWNGRLEVVATDPIIIIDGAHNEDAARTLKESLELYFPGKKLEMIMGVFADKEYEKILEIMAPKIEELLTINAPTSRGLPSSDLKNAAKKYCDNVVDAKNINNALRLAKEKNSEVIIVFGSLSFLNEIYKYLAIE